MVSIFSVIELDGVFFCDIGTDILEIGIKGKLVQYFLTVEMSLGRLKIQN